MPPSRKSIEVLGSNKGPARPTSGGYAARKFRMWTGSWLAYVGIHRNSAKGVARLLHKATIRQTWVRAVTSDKDGIIEIMGRGPPTLNTGEDDTTLMTSKGRDFPTIRQARYLHGSRSYAPDPAAGVVSLRLAFFLPFE